MEPYTTILHPGINTELILKFREFEELIRTAQNHMVNPTVTQCEFMDLILNGEVLQDYKNHPAYVQSRFDK